MPRRQTTAKTRRLRALVERHVRAFDSNERFAERSGMTLSGFLRALKADRMDPVHLLRLADVTNEDPLQVLRAGGQKELADLIAKFYGRWTDTPLPLPLT